MAENTARYRKQFEEFKLWLFYPDLNELIPTREAPTPCDNVIK